LKRGGTLNGGPTERCDIDRSGGVSPFFNLTSPAGDKNPISGSIRIAGGIFSTRGAVTGASFTIDGKTITSCAAANYTSFDITCTLPAGIDNGRYKFVATATDSGGSNSVSYYETVGSQVNGSFTFSGLPAGSVTYGVNVGPGGVPTSYNITVTYTGSTPLNNVRICEYKNNTFLACHPAIHGDCKYCWRCCN
jgi:hypothetical protein